MNKHPLEMATLIRTGRAWLALDRVACEHGLVTTEDGSCATCGLPAALVKAAIARRVGTYYELPAYPDSRTPADERLAAWPRSAIPAPSDR